MLQSLLEALTALGLMSGVARSASIYALTSASHVLGIALLLGPILLADLRIAGLLMAIDEPAVAVLRKTARLGALLTVLTGILLFSAKPVDYGANLVVWAKLVVVLAALLNAVLFEVQSRRRGIAALMSGGGRSFAIISATLWLTALLLGRWIAFV
jgi:hypothetical protein